jgi:hypothetical protein
MCRGKRICSELGELEADWSKEAPLPPPSWFQVELTKFHNASKKVSCGAVDEGTHLLSNVRSDDLRECFVEHGQVSGRARVRLLGTRRSIENAEERDPLRSSNSLAPEVFRRDGYRCRYCGIGVVPSQALSWFARAVGSQFFRPTGSNSQRHGVILAFRANADYVVPWNL